MNITIEPGAAALLDALHRAGFAAYAVGGCVRDSLLGLAPVSYTHLSKFFSSPIRSVIMPPTSPRSLVDTLESAASEKSPIFFWQAEPYCSTCWLLVMSIF